MAMKGNYAFSKGPYQVIPLEIFILILVSRFLMNKMKIKLLMKNPALTKEIRIFTFLVNFCVVRYLLF